MEPIREAQAEQGSTQPVGPIERIEQWAVTVVLIVMAVFTLLEVLGRSFLHAGVPGGLLYTQHLTLWSGFLGGLYATTRGGHLGLATGSLLAVGKLQRATRVFQNSAAAAVCAMLAYAS